MTNPGSRSTLGVVRNYDATLELAHLLAVIESAAKEIHAIGSDIDAAILRAHGAQLAAGREWPGMPVRSTIDFPEVKSA